MALFCKHIPFTLSVSEELSLLTNHLVIDNSFDVGIIVESLVSSGVKLKVILLVEILK